MDRRKEHHAPFLILAAFLAAFLLPTEPSFSQAKDEVFRATCQDAEHVEGILKKRHKEQPAGGGATRNGGYLEIWKSHNGRTWSLLLFLPDGRACMIGSGENWREKKTPSKMGPRA